MFFYQYMVWYNVFKIIEKRVFYGKYTKANYAGFYYFFKAKK